MDKRNYIIGVLSLIIVALLIKTTGVSKLKENARELKNEEIAGKEVVENVGEVKEEDSINIGDRTNYDIIDYELEIEYYNDEYEYEYELKKDGRIKAKVQNKKNKLQLEGTQAANMIEKQLLIIDYNQPDEDIIRGVLNSLNLDYNYEEFQLEIEYDNYNKKKVKHYGGISNMNTTNKSESITKNAGINTTDSLNSADNNIKEYELEVEYLNGDVKYEYERKSDRIKAEYENEITNEYFYGDEAKRIIENNLLTLDYNSGDEQIISSILNSLNLGDNYLEFELEIEYMNHSKMKIKRKS